MAVTLLGLDPLVTAAVNAKSRVDTAKPAAIRVGALAMFAYLFVRGQIDSVTALTRYLLSTCRSSKTTTEERKW
jgi:hypothetical protein